MKTIIISNLCRDSGKIMFIQQKNISVILHESEEEEQSHHTPIMPTRL